MDLSHVVWIGGPPASGKSTVAAALAERFGLQLYDVDAHAGSHEARMPRVGVAADADADARMKSFVAESRHRLRLVLEDLRELPSAPPCVAAGPFFPTSVSAVLREPEQAIFLMPVLDEGRIARTIGWEARDLRLTVMPFDGDLAEAVELVCAHFAPLLERLSGAAGTSP